MSGRPLSDKELEEMRALLAGGSRQRVVQAIARFLREQEREERERDEQRKLQS